VQPCNVRWKRACPKHAFVDRVIVRFHAVDPQDKKGENEQQPEDDAKALEENTVSLLSGVSTISVRLTRGTSPGEAL